MSSALRRLQAVQHVIATDPKTSPFLILPDDAKVELTEFESSDGSTQVVINGEVVSVYHTLSRTLPLLLSVVGTPYENTDATHIPKNPVVELYPPPPGTNSNQSISLSDMWGTVYALFTLHHSRENIPLVLTATIANREELQDYILRSGLGRRQHTLPRSGSGPELFLSRAAFWQGGGTLGYHQRGWLSRSPNASVAPFPSVQSFTRTPLVITAHPLRPPKPLQGECLYKRFCPSVGQILDFTHISLEDGGRHLAAFHKWHNDPRVNKGWKEEGPVEQHVEYIKKVLEDPAVLALMMSWDGELMGYCELVWIKENHVSQYIPDGAKDWDRGVHVLVGEEKFRGLARSETWLRGLAHYSFLAEPRTDRVLGEPNADNVGIMTTSLAAGFHAHSIFDFPYKRSYLTMNPRDRFFKSDML